MSGHRDDVTFAEDKAHHPNRRPPTPLENWNRYKTQGEKDKERFRGYADEIIKNGGNPDALGHPSLDPYDGFKTPSSLNDPAWEKYEDDHHAMIEKGNEPEIEHGDYYERQISDDARRE
jgi:hypothetical protein